MRRHAGRGRAGVSIRDLGVAVGAVGVDLVLFTQLSDATDQTGWVSRTVPALVIIVAGLAAAVPLALRRRFPYAVCLILAAYAATMTVLIGSRPLVSLLVALYGAAVWLPRRRALVVLVAVLAAHAVSVSYEASFAGISGFAVGAVASVYLLVDVATWGAGRWGASAQARRTAQRLEHERTALAAAAVDAERLRISHDLHDIVAHAVTVMLLQAGGARAVLRGSDDARVSGRALAALDAVDVTGRQAIAELRRLLTVLRAEGIDESGESDTPAGLVELPALVDRVRATGVVVEVRVVGEPLALDPSVDLTAYRVLQEALTNVDKYAGPGSRADVTMNWSADRLMITVTDDGPHGPIGGRCQTPAYCAAPGNAPVCVVVVAERTPLSDSSSALPDTSPGTCSLLPPFNTTLLGSLGSGGFGLIGLTERVSLVGGRLEHAPLPDRPGYRVVAWLPVAVQALDDPIDELLGVADHDHRVAGRRRAAGADGTVHDHRR